MSLTWYSRIKPEDENYKKKLLQVVSSEEIYTSKLAIVGTWPSLKSDAKTKWPPSVKLQKISTGSHSVALSRPEFLNNYHRNLRTLPVFPDHNNEFRFCECVTSRASK